MNLEKQQTLERHFVVKIENSYHHLCFQNRSKIKIYKLSLPVL
jgi:hypothetical protein